MKTDSFWKEILERFFESFLAFFFPAIYQDIDFSKGYRFLDKEFQQISRGAKTGRKIVDKLVKVFLNDGSEQWLLIHIEIQGQKEKGFARRMFIYNYRIFDKYRKEVISLALLTDQDRSYRPGHYEVARWGFALTFKFPLVKIIDYIDYDFERVERNNPFALIVQAFLKTLETEGDDQKRYAWKRHFLLRLYALGFSRETLYELYRFTEWIMELPEPLEERLYWEIKQKEEQETMSYITYAEKRGLKEGQEKGLRQAIKLLLEARFGKVEADIARKLAKINSQKKLEALLFALERSQNLAEFRAHLENEG